MLGKFDVLMRADCMTADLPLLEPYVIGNFTAAVAGAANLGRYRFKRAVHVVKLRNDAQRDGISSHLVLSLLTTNGVRHEVSPENSRGKTFCRNFRGSPPLAQPSIY